MTLISAHQTKRSPIHLARFTKEEFETNITSYKTPWRKDSDQDFPLSSAKDLGLSQEAFTALKILFPYLDKVFRAKGANHMPQLHSTVANHLSGLQKICDDIFSEDKRNQLPENLKKDFDELKQKLRLSLLVHDLAELPGEISTFCQRLDKSVVSEEDRHELENKVAQQLIFHALKAAHEKKGRLDKNIHDAIMASQKAMQDCDLAEERFRLIQNFSRAIEPETPETKPNENFSKDYEQLTAAYHLAEASSEQGFLSYLVRLIDRLDSKIHCGVVGDYTDFKFEPKKIFAAEFVMLETLMEKFDAEPLLAHIIDPLLKLYKQAVALYREWDPLKEDLTCFANPQLMSKTGMKELLESFLDISIFFRQFDPKYKHDIEAYMNQDIDKLRWAAPDEKTVLEALLTLSSEEQRRAKEFKKTVSTARFQALEESFRKQQRAAAGQVYKVITGIITCFEQLHSLFPDLSEKDFERKIFQPYLKDFLVALMEMQTVKEKPIGKKKPATPKLETNKKKILSDLNKRDIFDGLATLLSDLAQTYNSENARRFAQALRLKFQIETQLS